MDSPDQYDTHKERVVRQAVHISLHSDLSQTTSHYRFFSWCPGLQLVHRLWLSRQAAVTRGRPIEHAVQQLRSPPIRIDAQSGSRRKKQVAGQPGSQEGREAKRRRSQAARQPGSQAARQPGSLAAWQGGEAERQKGGEAVSKHLCTRTSPLRPSSAFSLRSSRTSSTFSLRVAWSPREPSARLDARSRPEPCAPSTAPI